MSVRKLNSYGRQKPVKKANQEVGNLKFVVFQVIAYRIYIVYGVILHFLRLSLDVYSL